MADSRGPYGKLCGIATWTPVDRHLGSEMQYVVCARRKLYGNIFGQGFDSPHLHQLLSEINLLNYIRWIKSARRAYALWALFTFVEEPC